MDLIEAARRAGVKGVAIAKSLGVAQSTVNRWLHRDVAVPSRYVRDLADLLKITADDVLPPRKEPQ